MKNTLEKKEPSVLQNFAQLLRTVIFTDDEEVEWGRYRVDERWGHGDHHR